MKNILVALSLLALPFFFVHCSDKAAPVETFNTPEVSSLPDVGGLPPGVMMLKTYGVGSNMENAKHEAVKNAVRAIIFKGVPGSSVRMALVPKPDMHKLFFEKFFAPDGAYKNYVSEVTVEPEGTTSLKHGKKQACMRVSVNYKALIKYLEDEKIIAKMGI